MSYDNKLGGRYLLYKDAINNAEINSSAMAKLILLAFFVVIVVVMGAPAEEYESSVAEHEVEHVDNGHVRVRRVTCDLLSAGSWFQDTACAANCLRLGNRGGHCSKGVCRCRK